MFTNSTTLEEFKILLIIDMSPNLFNMRELSLLLYFTPQKTQENIDILLEKKIIKKVKDNYTSIVDFDTKMFKKLYKKFEKNITRNIIKALCFYHLDDDKNLYQSINQAMKKTDRSFIHESLIAQTLHDILLKYKPHSKNLSSCREFLALGIELLSLIYDYPWNIPKRDQLHLKLRGIAYLLNDERSIAQVNGFWATLTRNNISESLQEKTFAVLEKCVKTIYSFDDMDSIIQNIHAICHYYYSIGDFRRVASFVYFHTVIPRDIIPIRFTPWIYHRAATSLLDRGNHEQALNILKNALLLANQTKNVNYIYYCTACISYVYINEEKYEMAHQILHEVINECTDENVMTYGMQRIFKTMAYCLYRMGKIKESHDMYLESVSYINKEKTLLYEYSGLPFIIELFAAYDKEGHVSENELSYLDEIKKAAHSNIIYIRASAKYHLALKRIDLYSYDDKIALELLHESMELFSKAEIYSKECIVILEVIKSYIYQEKHDEAVKYINLLIELNQKHGYSCWDSSFDSYKNQTKKIEWNEQKEQLKSFINKLFTVKKTQSEISNHNLVFHNLLAIMLNIYSAMQGSIYKVEKNAYKREVLANLLTPQAYKDENIIFSKHLLDKVKNEKRDYVENSKAEELFKNIPEYKTNIFFYLPISNEEIYIMHISTFQTSLSQLYTSSEYMQTINKFLCSEILASLKANNFWEKQVLQTRELLHSDQKIIYKDPSIEQLLESADLVSQTDAAVFIKGESGVGKELIAQRIHQQSQREGMLVTINMSSIPEELFESEFFGHEKGSFTNAHKQKQGLLELANNGTLFIDEVGDIPYKMQVKLLRVLQDKAFMRVGGTQLIRSNFRLITATHVDLEKAIEEKRFRQDLFYRINVIPLTIPALRERKEDILLIANYYISYYCAKHRISMRNLSAQDKKVMMHYPWHGNVRELKNFCERFTLMPNISVKQLLQLNEDETTRLPQTELLLPAKYKKQSQEVFLENTLPSQEEETKTMKEIQDMYLEYIFLQKNGIVGGTNGIAKSLNISINTAHTWINRLKLREKYEMKLQKVL